MLPVTAGMLFNQLCLQMKDISRLAASYSNGLCGSKRAVRHTTRVPIQEHYRKICSKIPTDQPFLCHLPYHLKIGALPPLLPRRRSRRAILIYFIITPDQKLVAAWQETTVFTADEEEMANTCCNTNGRANFTHEAPHQLLCSKAAVPVGDHVSLFLSPSMEQLQ